MGMDGCMIPGVKKGKFPEIDDSFQRDDSRLQACSGICRFAFPWSRPSIAHQDLVWWLDGEAADMQKWQFLFSKGVELSSFPYIWYPIISSDYFWHPWQVLSSHFFSEVQKMSGGFIHKCKVIANPTASPSPGSRSCRAWTLSRWSQPMTILLQIALVSQSCLRHWDNPENGVWV